MSLSIDEMMKRLGAISEKDGVPFARVHLLFDAENAHATEVLKLKGYLALSDAFKCFFLETVESVNTDVRPKVTKALPATYAMFVPRIAHNFHSACAAERVAINGYPYQGYTLLRNVFDNAVLTSAALQRVTDFYSIEGVVPDEEFDRIKAKKLRKETEYTTRRSMTGDRSGLRKETIDELVIWDALFDYETHGGRLSATHAVGFMKGTAPLPVLPKFDEQSFALFMNRYSEVTWMLHRLTPLLQPVEVALPAAWAEKWQLLDECFITMVESLTTRLGKPIGAAMVELVNAKFPFTSKTAFPL